MKFTLLKNKVTGIRSVRNNKTGETVVESENPELYAQLRKKAIANIERASRDDCMRSLGMVKTYGSVSGKVYWE